MLVFIVGYRGVGKTTVGTTLAQMLAVPFYDVDKMVEECARKTISEIVAQDGWKAFREQEKEIIKKVSRQSEGVVSTGGGAITDEENIKCIKTAGAVVWLKADITTIVTRIKNDVTSVSGRPSLSNDDLYAETGKLLTQREPIYQSIAEITVTTVDKNITTIVEEIYKQISLLSS
ncbi:MAG: shikimate kinase [Deltaproteobacteria bacterium]